MCNFLQAAPSLKLAASEIVFGMYNKQKFRFYNVITSRLVDINSDFEDPE